MPTLTPIPSNSDYILGSHISWDGKSFYCGFSSALWSTLCRLQSRSEDSLWRIDPKYYNFNRQSQSVDTLKGILRMKEWVEYYNNLVLRISPLPLILPFPSPRAKFTNPESLLGGLDWENKIVIYWGRNILAERDSSDHTHFARKSQIYYYYLLLRFLSSVALWFRSLQLSRETCVCRLLPWNKMLCLVTEEETIPCRPP